MEQLHAQANDVLSARLRSTSRIFPQSRHEWLTQPADPASASNLPPACNGALLQLRVAEQTPAAPLTAAAAHTADDHDSVVTPTHTGGVHLSPARVRTWASRDWAKPQATSLEWMGVELSNLPSRSATGLDQPALPPRLQWRVQQYLVREGATRGTAGAEFAERALDSSLSLRWRVASPSAAAAAADPALSAHVTLHSSVVTNLKAAAQAKPTAAAPVGSIVAGTASVGFQSPAAAVSTVGGVTRTVPANQLRAEVFGSSDGLLTGVSVLKTFQHGAGSRLTDAARDWITSVWPAQLPRLQVCSTSVGLEYAWVQAADDFTAGFGATQQFRWLPSAASVGPGATAAVSSLPPATVSLSAQAMGHAVASLHVPLTRRLTVATQAHVQLTNLESLGRVGARYALNDSQTVAVAGDTRGGLQLALRTHRRPASTVRRSPIPWLSWLSRHATLQLHVQAFPLLPALTPAWNVPQTTVIGSSYSPAAMRALQSPHLHVGGGIEFEF